MRMMSPAPYHLPKEWAFLKNKHPATEHITGYAPVEDEARLLLMSISSQSRHVVLETWRNDAPALDAGAESHENKAYWRERIKRFLELLKSLEFQSSDFDYENTKVS